MYCYQITNFAAILDAMQLTIRIQIELENQMEYTIGTVIRLAAN